MAASSVSTTAGATAAAQASASKQSLDSDKTEFLTLLTAQLQNQDPTSPMDSTQFTQQLVEYSQVEQEIDTNSNLSTLITLTQQNVLSSASSYIGKTVDATSDSAPLQNGEMNLTYNLSANSANTTIAISDSTGNVVYSTTGSTTAGTYNFNWNGQSTSGAQEPDGAYKVTITALGSSGTPVTTTTTVQGTVTSATLDPTTNDLMLDMGGVTVPLSDVTSVSS